MKRIFCFLLIGVMAVALAGPSLAAVKKPVKKTPAKTTKPAAPKATPVATSAPAVQPVAALRAGFFYEGGLAGGAGALEVGYGRAISDRLYLSGAAGYGVGSGFGVVIIDPIKATYDLGGFFAGGGLNYAMYSALVSGVPGISGTISNKNMFGVEVFAGKQFDKLSAKLGYSTALGLRFGVGYEF
jgi:hypothetical protein